ncbi:MAG: ATP-dependent zinc metalloprotease FtsH [Candidatus Omnitrophota bacterium]
MLKSNQPFLKKNSKPSFKRKNSRKTSPVPSGGGLFFWLIIGSVLLMIATSQPLDTIGPQKEITYSEFYKTLETNPETGEIQELTLRESPEENYVFGKLSDGTNFKLLVPREDEELIKLMRSNVSDFDVQPSANFWSRLFIQLAPVALIILAIWFISYRGTQMGNKIWSFGKSRARTSHKDSRVTFNDVAGVDEAKEELQEVIEFLREPKKFQRLGGKIPRGVLLVGHPGTGKTLLAKAVAGEAEVPFFSLSGSDFVEMFVGVGASRVRDLFNQARKASQLSGKGAIVFIDEIDAVGRQRFSGIGGGNDEREQTLNALLVEMDGFTPQSGVIIIAATNRPDTLDPALLRPGRFDRQIVVTLPDIDGREQILKVHTRNIKVGPDVNLKKIARQTVYFSGADLANACNEAALLAARRNKEQVQMQDFLDAVERVTMGPEKKSRRISKKEKTQTAYHEAGHALLSLLIDEVDTFTKVSIIPRGMAGGYTLTPPKEDKHYLNKSELIGRMTVLLGGLVAEEILMNDNTTGVSNDLDNVTSIARAMVCEYGMSELGKMAFGQNHRHVFLGRDLMNHEKDYSENTARLIDEQVQRMVDQAYKRARQLLTEHQDKLDLIAKRLIEREVIDIEETYELLGMKKPEEPVAEEGEEQQTEPPEVKISEPKGEMI